MNTLEGKIIVITGASSGIGEKIARKVAEKGAIPILIARSIKKLQKLSEEIEEASSVQCKYYQLDVSEMDQVTEVFVNIINEVGRIDILINNAGFGIFDSFQEAKLEEIEKMFMVNVLGLMACTKQVLPAMLKRSTGHIVNIASQAGKLATPKSSGYAASKHAVLGFTNSLRMELAKTNITVSSVNPGPIETDFFTIADRSGDYVKNVKRYMLQSEAVARKVVQLLINPKRELNLPRWMSVGSKLYLLFPSIAEKLITPLLDRK